jgi:hypothetical protein
VCSFTGTVISPKAIVPFQIERGIASPYPAAEPICTRLRRPLRSGAR